MRDNQPKHRQMRKEARRLIRRKASMAGMPSLLIVCEGSETEPNYIGGLCSAKHVNMAAVKIVAGASRTDPISLVRSAHKIFDADRDFDRVFVVCDADDAAAIPQARQVAKRRLRRLDGKSIAVDLVVSHPSIEFWLFLHFEYSSRPYRSAAEVIAELRRHLPDYAKSLESTDFEATFHRLSAAPDPSVAGREPVPV